MVTMQEIGDSLGVSKAAVSLVLNGKDQGRIRRETAQAIRQTAQVMGYSPKKTSYSSEKKTRILGFISDHIATSPYAGRLILVPRRLRDSWVTSSSRSIRMGMTSCRPLKFLP